MNTLTQKQAKWYRTYYFATYMSEYIRDYIYVPMEHYNLSFHRLASEAIIEAAAGVTACLLRGEDEEVRRGILALQYDLRRGDRFGVCKNSVLYYCKMKAIACICRPFFYCTGDNGIVRGIRSRQPIDFRGFPGHPDLDFHRGPLPFWLLDALTTSDYYPERYAAGRVEDWVRDGFPTKRLREAWESYMPKSPEPYHISFLYRDKIPILRAVSGVITAQLARETAQVKPFRDRMDYFSNLYQLVR